MRYLAATLLLLLLLPALCGCIQQNPPPAQQTPVPRTVTSAVPTPTPYVKKEIDLSVWTTEHAVVVRYNGGKNAQDLVMFNVQIDNRDGKNVRTPIYNAELGKEYEFRYIGVVNPNTINIVGVFSDGTQQTVLIHYF